MEVWDIEFKMINPEIRLVSEKIVCGDYFKKYPHSECNIKDDGKCVKCPARIGKLYGPFSPTQPTGGSILLCGKRQSYFPFQCFVGPDWPMLIAVYFLIFSVNLIVLPIIAYLGWPVVLIGFVGFILLLYCYSAVACSNPGIVFDEYEEELVPFNTATTSNNNTITILNTSSTTMSSLPSSTTTTSNTAASLELSESMNPLNYNINHHNLSNPDYGVQSNDIESQQHTHKMNSNDGNNNNNNDYNCNHSDTDSSSNDSSTSLKRSDNDYDEEKNDEMIITNNSTSFIHKNNNGTIIASSVSSSSSSPSTSLSPTTVLASSSNNITNNSSTSNNNHHYHHHHHHSRNKKDQDRPTIECGTCEIQRPYTARHCHHCGVCIEDLDHHCPWCSKCIGKKNMIFFKSFLAILCFQCYFLIGSLVYYFIAISKKAPLPIGPQFPSYK